MRLADVSAGGNLQPVKKEVMIMTIHERAEALKKKLAAMGITTDAELQKALEETRIDIALFVNKPENGEKSA
ncbi:hypothetical protein [Mitsuokella sp.]